MLSLLLTTEPHRDETFTSFLLRTCQENQYESLSWITKLINIDVRQLAKPNPNKVNLYSLAQLLRIEEQSLWDLTFYKDIMYFESNGDPSSFKDHVNTEYDKVCPACFESEPYIKKSWNLKINMACPKHSLLLINFCPNCNKKISSIRSDIHKCNCGYKLTNLPRETLNESKVFHAKIVANAFYGEQLYENINDTILNSISYYSLTKLINSFWYRINLGRNGIGINQINTQDMELFAQLISIFDLFINWPHNFRDFLEEKKQNSTVIKNIRRDLYTKLYDPEFHIFLEEFLRYIEEQTKRPVRFRKYNNQINLISRTKAIKMSSMSTESFNKLVENGVLEEYVQVYNDNFITRSITVESLEKFMDYKKYIVFKTELAESIGLLSKQINLFEENNWIDRIELFSERNNKKSYYDIRFSERLINSIEKNNVVSILEEQSQETKYISFQKFYNRAVVKGITFIELIEELIDGIITIYKVPNKKPFKSTFLI